MSPLAAPSECREARLKKRRAPTSSGARQRPISLRRWVMVQFLTLMGWLLIGTMVNACIAWACVSIAPFKEQTFPTRPTPAQLFPTRGSNGMLGNWRVTRGVGWVCETNMGWRSSDGEFLYWQGE